MELFKKVFGLLIILSIIYIIVTLIGTSIPTIIPPPVSTVSNYQLINGPLGNNANANYSSQDRIAKKTAKQYNEPINKTILFTGNSSNMKTELLNEYFFSTQGTSDNMIDYHGLYVPIYENISDVYLNNSSYFSSLIGKVVYIEFNASYDNNSIIQVPYTVQSEKIINSSVAGPMVYWHLTQATGISNSTAINFNNENSFELRKTTTDIIGIYYNGTEILFPTG